MTLTLALCRRQRGAALVVCLIMLLGILLLGTSAAQIAVQEEKASRHDRDRQYAMAAAEAALRDAEQDVEQLPRADAFAAMAPAPAPGHCDGDAGSPHRGLCKPSAPDAPPAWLAAAIAQEEGAGVPHGHFTGRRLPAGAATASVRPPQYLIEVMDAPAKDAAEGQAPARMARITAIGFGRKERTQIVLQSYYRKGGAAGHGQRLAWREVANWEAGQTDGGGR